MNSLTRNELYSMVWSETILKIGHRLNIRATDITKMCVAHYIPTPPSGYWSKLKFNKQPPTPPLEGLDDTIDLSQWIIKPKRIKVEVDKSNNRRTYQSKEGQHPIIEEVRSNYKSDKNWESRKYHIYMDVSKGLINRSLGIVNQLLLRSIDYGFTIKSTSYGTKIEKDGELTEVGTREGYRRVKKENVKPWETEIKEPNGILYLRIGDSYRRKEYKDKKSASIEEQIDDILERLVSKIEYDLEMRRIRREEEDKKRKAYLILMEQKESIEKDLRLFRLMEVRSERFQRVKKLREYISELENKSDKTAADIEWIKWCEHAIDWFDPTIMKAHPKLDYVNRSTLSVKVLDENLERWGSYNQDLLWEYE